MPLRKRAILNSTNKTSKQLHSIPAMLAAALVASLALAPIETLTAQDWDPDGAAGIQGGAGTWNAASTNWTTDGGTTNVAYDTAADSVFSVLGGAVNVSGGQAIADLTFDADGYTVLGAQLAARPTTTIAVNTGTATIYSSLVDLSGPANVTKTGTGTLVLGGFNAFTGGLALNAGTVRANTNGAYGSGGVTAATGTTLDYANGVTVGNGVAVTGSVSLNQTGGTATQDGNVSGAGGVTKTGSGTLALSGSNSYSGSTTVNAGTLDVTGSIASTTVAVNTGGTLQADGSALADTAAVTLNGTGSLALTGAEAIGSLAGSGNVTNGGNLLTTGGNNASAIHSGIISGAGGLTKTGSGNQTLSGNNTYSGGTTVSGGTLSLGSNTAAGTGTITTTGSVIDYANGVNIANPININSDTTQLQVLAGSATQSGVISETAGPRPLEKIGAGELVLSAANTYTGATTITAGTLTAANGSALGVNSAVTVVGGATLNLTSTIGTGSLAGAGNVTLNANNMGVGSDNTSTGFSGVISGTGGVSKNGSGTQTFSGANTYTGNTVVNSGNLNVTGSLASTSNIINNGQLTAAAGALAAGASVSLNGGTFQNNGDNTIAALGSAAAGNVDLNAGTLTTGNAANQTIAGVMSGAGNLAKQGAGMLTLSATNTHSGLTTINAGTLELQNGAAITNGNVAADATAGSVLVNGAGTLLVTNAETIASLSGAGNASLTETLTTGDAGDDTFSGVASGAGGLTKQGTGTLTLSGANTYTGDTTVTAGTVQVGASERIANGSDLIVNGGVFDLNNFTETIANLSGAGGTIDTGGTMGGLTVNQTVDQTYAGNFSGVTDFITGTFLKNGAATLTLSGTNSQTGDGVVEIMAGRLAVQNGNAIGDNQFVRLTAAGSSFELLGDESIGGLSSIAGSNILLNGNTLTLLGDNLGFAIPSLYNGVISGSGGLIINNGNDTQTLGGTNTYTGTTTINGGTLQLESGTAIADTGAVNITGGTLAIFDPETIGSLAGTGGIVNLVAGLSVGDATTTSYAGVVQGTGGLTRQGTGSTTLSGINTYSGATTINGGTLVVNGSNSSSTTTVNAGGTLAGTGTVGNVFVAGGTFAPGNSIGTTMVAGNVDFTGGGIYMAEANPAGSSDLINATGTATLSSGIVQAMPEAGTYNFSTDYTILTAAGGLGGTEFASATSSLGNLDARLFYDANNAFLNLTRNDITFVGVASTPNQTAVGNVLTQLATSDPVAVTPILNNLVLLPDAAQREALDSLGGAQHAVNPGLSDKLMSRFMQLIRTNRGGSGSQATQLGFNAYNWPLLASNSQSTTGIVPDMKDHERNLWVQVFGGDGDIESTSRAAGTDYRQYGLVLGAEVPLNAHHVLGLAGSFSNTDVDGKGSDSDVQSYQLAAYGNWRKDGWNIDSAIAYAKHDTDTDRNVVVGASTTTAKADYDSDSLGVSIEAGKRVTRDGKLIVMPFVGLEYSQTDRDGFTETGSLANLTVRDTVEESVRSKMGFRFSRLFESSDGMSIVPSAHTAYVYEHGDTDHRMKAAFNIAPTNTFSIAGVETDRGRVQAGLGVAVKLSDKTKINVGYEGEFAGSDDYHSLDATFSMNW